MQGQASKVARGLRSFGNQIAKTATSAGELEFEVQGATKAISLMGKDGNLKSTYKVLKEISAEWDNMTTAERQALGISLAGKTQFEVFTAVLTNFEGAEKALLLARQAEGSAWRENARYMESVEAKYQALKTALENLVLGNGGLQTFVKLILDVTTAIVKFIDSCGGLTTVIGVLTSALIILNSKAIMSLIMNIPTMIQQITELKVAYIQFATSATTANEIMTASIPIIGLVVLAFTAVFAIIKKISNAHKDFMNSIEELNRKISVEKNEVNEINSELDMLRERIEEINSQDDIGIVDEQESKELAYQVEQLERELALKKEILSEDQKTAQRKLNTLLGGRTSSKEDALNAGNITASVLGSDGYLNSDYIIDYSNMGYTDRIKSYTDIKEALEAQLVVLKEEQSQLKENTEEYEANELKIQETTDRIEAYRGILNEMVGDLRTATEGVDENSEEYHKSQEAINYYADSLLKSKSAEEVEAETQEKIKKLLQDTTNEYHLSAEQQKELSDAIDNAVAEKEDEENAYIVAMRAQSEYIEGLGLAEEETKSYTQLMEEWNSTMDSIQSSYETLSSAIDEYNASQGFSLDTAQALLSLEPEYLAMLQFENGQLSLNKEALMLKAKAHIEDAKALVYDQATAELNALAQNKVEGANKKATTEVKTETQALYDNSKALAENSKQAYENAYAKAKQAGVSEAEMRAVTDKMKNQLKVLDSLADSFGNNIGKAMEKTGSSASKANKQVEKLKETIQSLKDEISDYDKVIAYINSKLDGEIKRLEDLRDAEVEAIEKEIKALERELDTEEDNVKAKIDLLESERDAIIDSNKEQISVLEEKQNLETKYWDEKIQALKDQNNALQEQADLEKLLQDLETARNTKVRVYKKGQGFVWDVDQDKVNKAQKALDAYNQKKDYERKLAELENYKKESIAKYEEEINYLKEYNNQVKNSYDKQISDLNNYLNEFKIRYNKRINDLKDNSEKVKEQYEIQIKYFQKYKDEFEKQCKAYETEQNRLLALQKTGIDFENENWKTRLSNLSNFTTEYNKKLAELEEKEKRLKQLESSVGSSSGGYTGGNNNNNSSTTTTTQRTKTVYVVNGREYQTYNEASSARDSYNNPINSQISSLKSQMSKVHTGNSSADEAQKRGIQSQIDALERKKVGISTKTVAYAKGTASIGSNQFAIVGENPNKEIVIGSSLNGMGLNLSRGTGVVNAKSTNTLAGLFNMLGSELKSVNGDYSAVSTNNQNANNIHIDNISLPQVRDAEDFIDALSNFQNIMAQKAYAVI